MRSLVRVLGAALLFAASLGAAAASLPKFDQVERELNLRPDQKIQCDIAVASTQRALLGVALSAMQMKQQLADEIAKPLPDFSTLANAHERIAEQNRPLFDAAGLEWKKFYAMLDPQQLEFARKYLRDSVDRLFDQFGSAVSELGKR